MKGKIMFTQEILNQSDTNVNSTLLSWALGYARRGFYVIPLHNPIGEGKCSCGDLKCKHVGKHPRIKDWQNKCTTDESIIRQWWEQWPDANIGIVAGKSGLVVVDVDKRNGGFVSLMSLQGKGSMEEFLLSFTGDGRHLIYKNGGMSFKNGTNLLPGIDIKGDGGFFVAPPSLHESGKRYRFPTQTLDSEISNIPHWLVEELLEGKTNAKESSSGKKLKRSPSDILKGVPYLERDETIFRYACGLRERVKVYDEAKVLVLEASRNCTPPFEEDEAMKCLDSAWSYRESAEEEEPTVISAAELALKEIPPTLWLVKDFLPDGTSLLCGNPKGGKSAMSMGIALSVATGGSFLEHFDPVGKVGSVLYIALEDSEKRLKDRLLKLNHNLNFPDNVFFTRKWAKGEKGIDDLRKYLDKNPDTILVVVDTLEKIRPVLQIGANPYSHDYAAIAPFQDIAAEYSIGILIIHHTRKASSDNPLHRVSGTQGLTGAADQIMVLERNPKSNTGTLDIIGRDIEEVTLNLNFEKERVKWSWASIESIMSEQRAAILQILREDTDALGPKEIAEYSGQKSNNVRKLLLSMVKDGQLVKKTRGRYTISS